MALNNPNGEAGQLHEWAPGQTLRLIFNEILLEMLQKNLPLKKEKLPPDLGHKKVDQDDGVIEQRSSLYRYEKVQSIKLSAFNAEGMVYVRTAVIWPADNYDFPAFIYDSVETKRWLMLLIDLHPMRRDKEYMEHYAAPLAPIRAKYKDIPLLAGGRTEVREWLKPYSSGQNLLIRCPKEYEPQMEQAFKDYVNFYVEKVNEAQPAEDAGRQTEVVAYKNKFRAVYAENDPGGGPLKTFFGKEWTERFLNEFLFA